MQWLVKVQMNFRRKEDGEEVRGWTIKNTPLGWIMSRWYFIYPRNSLPLHHTALQRRSEDGESFILLFCFGITHLKWDEILKQFPNLIERKARRADVKKVSINRIPFAVLAWKKASGIKLMLFFDFSSCAGFSCWCQSQELCRFCCCVANYFVFISPRLRTQFELQSTSSTKESKITSL